MGPAAALTQVAHLFRRAGFGATEPQIAAAAAAGYSNTVDQLVGGLGGPDPGADAVADPQLSVDPAELDIAQLRADSAARKTYEVALRRDLIALSDWWLGRMLATTNPLQEKLTFLLHGHFPTAVSKVRFSTYMYGQNQIFRTLGSGGFDALTQAVSADPAMLIWLDADSDEASDPNENFARELMERFTMGIGAYTESDVRAAAVCFTGWTLDRADGVDGDPAVAARPDAPDVSGPCRGRQRPAGDRHRHPQRRLGLLRARRLVEPPGLPGDDRPIAWSPTCHLRTRATATSATCSAPS